MPKGSNQKLKLLYLMKILLERTDEAHAITLSEVLEALEGYGVTAERKSIYDDLEALRLYGLDVVRQGRYYFVANREFQLPELKLLVDAVQSCKFITQKKSAQLIKKLEGLASTHEARVLQRQVYVSSRVKTGNEQVYYNIDRLHDAIAQEVQIDFLYFEWQLDYAVQGALRKSYRREGARYRVSPWALTWADENYYLIAYDPAANDIRHYRVDKMEDICITGLPREGQRQFERFDVGVYTSKLFGMFGGEEQEVRLQFSNRLVGVVVDRFGRDRVFSRVDGEHFAVTIRVVVSPQFLSWLFSFGQEAVVLSPKPVADQLRRMALLVAQQYPH